MPRKLKPASINIADAKLAADITITAPITLGRICRKMILEFLKPRALPASTNSFSLILSICPRTTRATSTHIVKPTAINTCQKPFPKANVMAITNNNVGIDHTTLINQTIKLSTHPLKKPDNAPNNIPITKDINTEINPTERLTRVPIMSWLNTSLP